MSLKKVSVLAIFCLVGLQVCAMAPASDGYVAGDDRYVTASPTRRRTSSIDLGDRGAPGADSDVLRPEELRSRTRGLSGFILETRAVRRAREKKQFENGVACCCVGVAGVAVVACLTFRAVLELAQRNNGHFKQD